MAQKKKEGSSPPGVARTAAARRAKKQGTIPELIFYEPRWFYSQLDENAYYGWLGQLHDVNKIRHLRFQTLGLQFPKGLSDDKLRELLAICARFDIPTDSIRRYLKETAPAKSRGEPVLPQLSSASTPEMWTLRSKPVCLGRMPRFRSAGDAICFFTWLAQLGAIGSWKVEDRRFSISVRKANIVPADMRDLLAFCWRYDLDMKPLRGFCLQADRKYFFDKKAYWYKRLFEK